MDSPSDLSGVLQPSPIEQHYKDLSGGIEKDLLTTKKDLEALLQKQMRLEMGPSEGPGDFLGLENTKSREKLKNLLQASIKMKALQMEHLQRHRDQDQQHNHECCLGVLRRQSSVVVLPCRLGGLSHSMS